MNNEMARLRSALESIAGNTCCDKCQEAALVARAALVAQVEPVERSPIVNQNAVVWYSDNDGPDDIPTSVLGDCDFCDARNVEVVSTGRATVDWTPVACPSCRSRT